MAEHRVPMLGSALRRHRDPAASRDPRVRELVAALATVEAAPAPRPDFVAELRVQLVAVTPRLVEEGTAGLLTADEPKRQAAPDRRRVHVKRPLLVVASVLTAFVVLLGGAVLLSQNALPGDALYGLKRASENTEYALAGGAVDRGKLKLEFAARRIGEVADLLPKASALAAGTGAVADGGLNPSSAKLVRQTLASADSDVTSASRQLAGAAVSGNSAAPLNDLTDWTPDELTALAGIIARVASDAPTHAQAVHTRNLIAAAQQRATILRADLGCSCLDSSGSDELGPLPCSTGCAPTQPGTRNPSPGTGTGTPTPGRSSHPTGPHPAPTGQTPTKQPGSHPGGSSPAGGGGSTSPKPGAPSTSPKPRVSLPPLPLPTLGGGTSGSVPAPPVSIDSCGVHATLGPIGIGVGQC
jgi:hypothetical protein